MTSCIRLPPGAFRKVAFLSCTTRPSHTAAPHRLAPVSLFLLALTRLTAQLEILRVGLYRTLTTAIYDGLVLFLSDSSATILT